MKPPTIVQDELSPSAVSASVCRALLFALYTTVEEVSYLRGFSPGVQRWGSYPWFVSYRDGFVKRGLAGTVFQLFERVRPGDLASYQACLFDISILYFVLSQMLVLILALMFVYSLDRVPKPGKGLMALAWFTFAASQFLPTIAYNTGYLDVLVLLCCLFALLAWRANRYWLAAGIAALTPLIHEEFVFFWLCPAILMLGAARRDGRIGIAYILIGLAPIVTTAGALIAHSPHAIQLQLSRSPLDAELSEALLRVQFGQSLASAAAATLAKAVAGWRGAVVLAVIELVPTMLILALAGRACRAWGARNPGFGGVEIAAALAPLSVLLVAWDLSRYLVVTNFMAILCVYVVTRRGATG